MDPYTPLLERLRAPQPSMQRFAVISIFSNLRSSSETLDFQSEPGKQALHQCLHSNQAAIVDQTVRELCLLAKQGKTKPSVALIELQATLESCDHRFVAVFVKGIGFLCRFTFENDRSWSFDPPALHPFIKVLSCRADAHAELIHQVLVFIVHNKVTMFEDISKFLRPFMMFSVLMVPFSSTLSSFSRHLMSSMASLSCSLPSQGLDIVKLLMECLRFFPRKNVEELAYLISAAEYLVDAFASILQHMVASEKLIDEAQVCGVEMLEIILSFCTENENCGWIEPVIDLSKRLLLAQKGCGFNYVPEFCSVISSLSIILTQAEFEHEQLLILKLSVFLLKWKREDELYSTGRAAGLFSDELLFIFPVMHLMASPSKSVKAAATDLLFILENLLVELLDSLYKLSVPKTGYPSISTPESIVSSLLHHIWFQGQSLSNSYFLSLACNGKSEFNWTFRNSKSWLVQLKECSARTAQRQKSTLVSRSQEYPVSGMPLLLSSIVTTLVVHRTLASSSIDALAAIGSTDPRLGVSLLLSILFYNKILCNRNDSEEVLLKLLAMLPTLASHSVMAPLIVRTILPMLQKDATPILYATAIRLLCKTWESTDRVFGSLQGVLHPKAFMDFMSESNICISMAVSLRDVCKKHPDRGVDLILSVSACIESQVPTIQTLGFECLGHLCEADVVDFYTAWNVISKHLLDYSIDPTVAHGLCILLRWGAMDAEAYPDASKRILQILWEVGTSRHASHEYMWVKAQTAAFGSLIHYEVELTQQIIPGFKKRNIDWLLSEDNPKLLSAAEALVIKIMTFEHMTRRRLLKEKRVMVNKVEKLLDVFPQVLFSSGKRNGDATELPGAALLCHIFTPKDIQGQGTLKEMLRLQAVHESALTDIAESLPLSRNILAAFLSLQSWKPFMHRWMKAFVMVLDARGSSEGHDRSSKAADDILKGMCKIAERSLPRSAENIALAIGALCTVLPPSAHAATATASKFLLKWLFQHEHEYKQWSAAISLGLVSNCLHTTDWGLKFDIIGGLLKVACNSESILVKGACGVGLGFSSQDLLTGVEASTNSSLEGTSRHKEAALLGMIVRTLSMMICQLCPSTSDSLQNLCRFFPLGTGGFHAEEEITDFSCNGCDNLDEDVWGIAGLVMGLGNSVNCIYRAGAPDTLLQLKDTVMSWVPHVNYYAVDPSISSNVSEIPLAVGSCLALPAIVAVCQRAELMEEDLDSLVNGFIGLISELLAVKKSGTLHESLLMAACVGAGNLLSSILNEGVHHVKAEDVKLLLEMMRNAYINPYPPNVHLGSMLGVVNALGAGAGTLTQMYPQLSSLQMDSEQKESSHIRGPILSNPVCEPLSTSLMQEMFQVAQDSKDLQLQRHAAWAVAFLRHQLWSRESIVTNASQGDSSDSKPVSRSFAEDSIVWKLSSWLMNLNYSKTGTMPQVNTVSSVLRCLTQAPRLPSLDWGAIIRRCMRYEDQFSSNLNLDPALNKGTLREECIKFSCAHASHVNPLLSFLDELSDLARFGMLEHGLQCFLLAHLTDLMKIFSDSRMEKLYNDIFEYFRSSSHLTYNPDQRSLLRISFWGGLSNCLIEDSTDPIPYISSMEKCMELIFSLLPMLPIHDGLGVDPGNSELEWSESVRCLGKARKIWLMNILQVSKMGSTQGESQFSETAKRIFAIARLVMIDCIPVSELRKLKPYLLNMESNGIWDVLVEVAAALQFVELSVKRQWLLDIVEICCTTKYPSTALRFLGLLCGSWSKYAPLLIVDPLAVLSDLPVTLPSLLSDSIWKPMTESFVDSLWASTERIYAWVTQLTSTDDHLDADNIDTSEISVSVFLVRVMHHSCVSLKEYLPFEKRLRLATMMIP